MSTPIDMAIVRAIDLAIAADMLVQHFTQSPGVDQHTQRLIDLYRIRKDREWTEEEQSEYDALRAASNQAREDAVQAYHDAE